MTRQPVRLCSPISCLNLCVHVLVDVWFLTQKSEFVCQHVWKFLCNNNMRFSLAFPLCNSAPSTGVYEYMQNPFQMLQARELSQFRQVLGHFGVVARSGAGYTWMPETKKTVEIFPSCLWRKIHSCLKTLWRVTTKDRYFTAYTQGYYTARACKSIAKTHCYICL